MVAGFGPVGTWTFEVYLSVELGDSRNPGNGINDRYGRIPVHHQNEITVEVDHGADADEALQMHGGYGYIDEYKVQRLYRDAKILEIYEGTKEMEKAIISRSILK